jgi:4-amino-4-deoxy-L-arabinose transferase-like glycosyltransferase
VLIGLGLLLAVVVITWGVLQTRFPYLGHDEAVYASQARQWAQDVPAVSWRSYRPVGLPALGALMLWLAPGPIPAVLALRSITLLAAVGYVIATFLLARRFVGPYQALLAAAVLVTGVTFLRRMPEFLNDIAAAALLLAVAHQFLRARARPGVTRTAMTRAAVLAVLACLLRYGSVSGLLAIVLAALMTWGVRTWWRSLRDLRGALIVSVVATLVAVVAGLRSTGSPWGLFWTAGQVAHRQYIGDGVVFYVQAFPLLLAGPLGGAVMTVGLAQVVSGWWRRRASARTPDPRARDTDSARLFLALAAVLHVLILGVSAHGEQRFVLFPVAVLTVLGIDALARVSPPWRTRLLAGVTAALLPALVLSLVVVWRGGQVVTDDRQPLVEAVRTVPVDGPCLVVTPLVPETGWATTCRAVAVDEIGRVGPGTTVLVLRRDGYPEDPDPRELAASVDGRPWTTERLVVGPRERVVWVSRFPAAPSPGAS